MRKLILAGIFTLGVSLGYLYAANKAEMELELQNNPITDIDNDLSVIRVFGEDESN